MLETMRNASKGWLAAVLILLLVASFGLWGVQDMINLTSARKIASVGDRDITPEEFQREFGRFLQLMERQSGAQVSSADAKKLGLDREALDRMLTGLAVVEKASAAGFSFSQNQVVDTIKQIPGLSDGRGGVNLNALQQILQQGQFSQEEFMDVVRRDVLRQQFMSTMLVGITMPAGMDAALNRFRLERRVIEYIVIDPARAGEIKDPDDTALRKFYETNAAARYAIPEYRSISLVTAGQADVKAQIQVTEEEIKRAYDRDKRTYETPEKRVLEQIRFKSEAAAHAAKAKLAGGTSFEDVAKAEGYKPEDIKLGEVGKDSTTIPKAAFEIPLNTASDPVQGPFGWVILRALSTTPGTLKTLSDVHDEIRDKIATERAKEKLFELTSDFEDTLGSGATLEEAAKKHNLSLLKVTVDARGMSEDGKAVEGLPGGDFLQRAFVADRAVDSGLLDAGENVYYEFRVDSITPSGRKPFNEVRAEVLADWRAEELAKRLNAVADDLVKSGNAGRSMEALASPLGVAPLLSDPLPRYGSNPIFHADTLTAAHEAKVGAFFKGPVSAGKSVVVARLASIDYLPEEPSSPERAMYSANLREAFTRDFVQQLGNVVREEIGVTIDEAEFAKFHTGE